MPTDNRVVDHLDSGIVGNGKCVYDAAPDTSPPPANKSGCSKSCKDRMPPEDHAMAPRIEEPSRCH